MAKELHLVNRGWVNPDKSMVMSHRFDARLLVQSQWEPIAIELLLLDISSLHIGAPNEFWGATGRVVIHTFPVEGASISLNFDNDLKVTCGRLFYVDRTSWTGPDCRFGREVPHPDCVPATTIEGTWRQCSACADAFEVNLGVEFVLCPNCGVLTELSHTAA
jgi:hypothetical protein